MACVLAAAGCVATAPNDAEVGWVVRLAEAPSPVQARSLEGLADVNTVAPGADAWRVERDHMGRGAVLCHEPGAEPWRRVPGEVAAGFEARVWARTEAGATESYGLAFRQGVATAYLARVDTRNNNVRLYRQENGAATLLAGRDLGVSVGKTHELAIRALGGRLAVALDGEPLLGVTDGAFNAGSIALWAESQTRVCFEGLWLAPLSTAP